MKSESECFGADRMRNKIVGDGMEEGIQMKEISRRNQEVI